MYNRDDNIRRYLYTNSNECGCGKIRSANNKTAQSQENRNIAVDNPGCGTNSGSSFGLAGFPLASVYAPLHDFAEIYDCETGLTRGTIFAELDLPFICGGMSGGVGRG